MTDYLVHAIAANGKIRAVACSIPELTQQICSLQGASPFVTIAMGRALTGAALMGALLKQGQRLALKFEGNGPVRKIIAEADWDGALRATAGQPEAVPPGEVSTLAVADILGKAGFLTITKDLGLKEPYRGMVQLHTSEIGEDLAWYLTDSEQIPSALGLTVNLDEHAQVAVAGGFLIQSLPPADDELVEQLMERISHLPSLSDWLQEGHTPEELITLLLDGLDAQIIGKRPLFFRCDCSEQKGEQALLSLGSQELSEIIQETGEACVTCEFCKQPYLFDTISLKNLLKSAAITTESA